MIWGEILKAVEAQQEEVAKLLEEERQAAVRSAGNKISGRTVSGVIDHFRHGNEKAPDNNNAPDGIAADVAIGGSTHNKRAALPPPEPSVELPPPPAKDTIKTKEEKSYFVTRPANLYQSEGNNSVFSPSSTLKKGKNTTRGGGGGNRDEIVLPSAEDGRTDLSKQHTQDNKSPHVHTFSSTFHYPSSDFYSVLSAAEHHRVKKEGDASGLVDTPLFASSAGPQQPPSSISLQHSTAENGPNKKEKLRNIISPADAAKGDDRKGNVNREVIEKNSAPPTGERIVKDEEEGKMTAQAGENTSSKIKRNLAGVLTNSEIARDATEKSDTTKRKNKKKKLSPVEESGGYNIRTPVRQKSSSSSPHARQAGLRTLERHVLQTNVERVLQLHQKEARVRSSGGGGRGEELIIEEEPHGAGRKETEERVASNNVVDVESWVAHLGRYSGRTSPNPLGQSSGPTGEPNRGQHGVGAPPMVILTAEEEVEAEDVNHGGEAARQQQQAQSSPPGGTARRRRSSITCLVTPETLIEELASMLSTSSYEPSTDAEDNMALSSGDDEMSGREEVGREIEQGRVKSSKNSNKVQEEGSGFEIMSSTVEGEGPSSREDLRRGDYDEHHPDHFSSASEFVRSVLRLPSDSNEPCLTAASEEEVPPSCCFVDWENGAERCELAINQMKWNHFATPGAIAEVSDDQDHDATTSGRIVDRVRTLVDECQTNICERMIIEASREWSFATQFELLEHHVMFCIVCLEEHESVVREAQREWTVMQRKARIAKRAQLVMMDEDVHHQRQQQQSSVRPRQTGQGAGMMHRRGIGGYSRAPPTHTHQQQQPRQQGYQDNNHHKQQEQQEPFVARGMKRVSRKVRLHFLGDIAEDVQCSLIVINGAVEPLQGQVAAPKVEFPMGEFNTPRSMNHPY